MITYFVWHVHSLELTFALQVEKEAKELFLDFHDAYLHADLVAMKDIVTDELFPVRSASEVSVSLCLSLKPSSSPGCAAWDQYEHVWAWPRQGLGCVRVLRDTQGTTHRCVGLQG